VTTAHQQDIVDDVITDHREVEEVFAEEQYLYAAARRVLRDALSERDT
jgi:hypothetical protein